MARPKKATDVVAQPKGVKRVYGVRFERDPESGWWVVTIPKVKGVLTQARTIAQGMERIREALALFIPEKEAARAELVREVFLGGDVDATLKALAEARKVAEAATRALQSTTHIVVRKLVGPAGLSLRDAGDVLGLSFQRVQQIATEDSADVN